MASGKITNWNADRGYGFVRPDDGGPDIFVHATVIEGEDAFERGDLIEFETQIQPDGRVKASRAKRVS